jgi:Ca-activated chloride channel family protein
VIRFSAAAVLAILAPAQQPSFRVDVNLVRVLATVQDAEGRLVGSLPKERFRLLDSGVPQEISVFERSTELPLSVAVLIDASGSTAKDLPAEIVAVRGFLRALLRGGNPEDAAALYAFNWEVAELAPFTRDLGRLERGLKRLKGEAGTSLYDALIFAAQDLETRQGRKIIVVVTDGGDTTSSHSFRDALRAAHLAEAVVYPILVVPVQTDAGRNVGGENALASLAYGTGGRVFQVSLGPALGEAFASVLADLRTQYLLGYYPRGLPPAVDAFREIRVEVLDHGRPPERLRVSARSGYYEESRRGGAR